MNCFNHFIAFYLNLILKNYILSDDVKQSNFEIVIEFYSYELFNAANNILQSARKVAKQFADFATFKRNTQQGTIGHANGQQQAHLNLANSTSNYPQSIHKFKLIARASLNQEDICEQVSTKCLKLVNDSGKIIQEVNSFFV